jgi:thioredoxin
MATIEISADNFEETITDNDIVLVDFWAEWCGPCKRFGPIYEKASEEYDGIVFAKLDTDAHPELTGMLGIEGIPTLMAFREGVEAGRRCRQGPRHGRGPRPGRQASGRAQSRGVTLDRFDEG